MQEAIAALGLLIIELVGKVPAYRYQWKQRAKAEVVTARSYGIVCDQIAVVDADSRAKAVEIYRTLPRTPWMVKTRRGVHFYYRGTPELRCRKFKKLDIKAGGDGYVVGPGSVVDGHRYELIGEITLDLPHFDPSWFTDYGSEAKSNVRTPATCPLLKRITRARNYVAKMKPAISGQGGHNRTFAVACRLVRDFNLTIEQAWPIMLEFNTRCEPPWNEVELLHKLEDAAKRN